MLEVSNQDKLIARLFKDTLIIFLLSMFVGTIGTVVDGIITGKFLGMEAIAAFGLTVPYQRFTAIFTLVMALGMQILCGKTLGTGKLREANEFFSQALTASVTVAIILLVGTNLLTEQIVDLLGATTDNDSVRAQTIEFLQAYSFALVPLTLTAIFTPIMQPDNDRRRAVISVIVISVCKVTGDLINIFVLDGGLFGIGIATAVSHWIAAGYLYLHFVKPESNFKFTLTRIKSKVLSEMLLIGSPVISDSVALMFGTEILNHLALTLAAAPALAAYTIVVNFSTLLQLIPDSISSSLQMISEVLIGERDGNSIRKLLKIAFKWTLIITPLLTIATFIAAPTIAELYTENDPKTYALTVEGLRWFALSLPLYAVALNFQYFYLPYGRVRLVNVLALCNNLAFLVPAAVFISTDNFTMREFWLTFVFNQAMFVVAVFAVTCRHCGRITFKLEDYLLLPDDFDVDEDSRLDITVTNKNEVVGLSERTQIFCRSHGINRRRSMFAGLCIEEMAGNIVDHGFGDGNKHFIDVRIIVKDSQVIIRIRDDCKSFDPKKWAELYNSDDSTAHIGIRLVSKIATEFNYVNVLKLNNLLIKI